MKKVIHILAVPPSIDRSAVRGAAAHFLAHMRSYETIEHLGADMDRHVQLFGSSGPEAEAAFGADCIDAVKGMQLAGCSFSDVVVIRRQKDVGENQWSAKPMSLLKSVRRRLTGIQSLAAEGRMRCGDTVDLIGEQITVAYADYALGRMSWPGWPSGRAPIADCKIVRRATDEEHYALVGKLIEAGRELGNKVDVMYGAAWRAWTTAKEAA